jgi:hypothetical protein
MRPKYQGLFTFILTLAVCAAAGGYYYSKIWRLPMPEPEFAGLVDDDAKALSDGQIQAMQRLMSRMTALAVPKNKSQDEVSMALFGQAPVLSGSIQPPAAAGNEGEYALSLTILAGAKRLCIINGSLFTQGASLPDGAVVAQIEPKKAKIISQGKIKWVPLIETGSATVSSAQPKGKGQS